MKRPAIPFATNFAGNAASLMSGCLQHRSSVPYRWKTSHPCFAIMAQINPQMLDNCRELYARPSPDVLKAIKTSRLRNGTLYLKKIADPDHFVLFNYLEYSGSDFQMDMAKLAACKIYARWRKDCDACLIAAADSSKPAWIELEPMFFTAGAAEAVPMPAKYARIAMITGLKPEKEMQYRRLHATVWPGVLKDIKDRNIRNFNIFLGEIGGKLYLLSYLEYVGADGVADTARAKALPVNQRWWKFTEACQEPLPEAAARNQIWSNMDEIHHHE
ncbi:MAG TPA: L-rhamnose mutarotase [Verrucomicrobiae bacterium]